MGCHNETESGQSYIMSLSSLKGGTSLSTMELHGSTSKDKSNSRTTEEPKTGSCTRVSSPSAYEHRFQRESGSWRQGEMFKVISAVWGTNGLKFESGDVD